MTDGQSSGLYLPGSSVVHRLPAPAKLVAHLVFVLVVVATPPLWLWAFAGYLGLLVALAMIVRIPAVTLLRRMTVEIPFVVFALLLPFVSSGPRQELLGASVSQMGLISGWNILAKGTIGVMASILLASTTDSRALLQGLRTLRLPARLVDIASFMVRYIGVVADDVRRMKIARESRGFEARHLGHARVLAQSAGALFIRTYERGERVHLAMLSRGGGSLAVAHGRPQTTSELLAAATLPLSAVGVLVAAWTLS